MMMQALSIVQVKMQVVQVEVGFEFEKSTVVFVHERGKRGGGVFVKVWILS